MVASIVIFGLLAALMFVVVRAWATAGHKHKPYLPDCKIWHREDGHDFELCTYRGSTFVIPVKESDD